MLGAMPDLLPMFILCAVGLGAGVLGGVIGYLTGIVASTGAINTPFFLAYGLLKDAYMASKRQRLWSCSSPKACPFTSLAC